MMYGLPAPRFRRYVARAVLAALAGAVPLLPRAAAAQSAADSSGAPPPGECYGFSFGRWDPPLDWAAAGHTIPKLLPPEARGTERGDASRAGLSGDSTLMLYPPWWPAGVLVRFTAVAPRSDTLSGTATALVADPRRPPPTAQVHVLRVPCGHPPPRTTVRDSG